MITMASKTFLDGFEYISPYKGFGYVYDQYGHLKNQMQEEVTQNDFVSFADHFYRFSFLQPADQNMWRNIYLSLCYQ